jgi:hypothetical protein
MDLFQAAMIMDGEWELTGYQPSDEAFIAAAQFLIDSGAVGQLQGRIGRICNDLVNEGLCTA